MERGRERQMEAGCRDWKPCERECQEYASSRSNPPGDFGDKFLFSADKSELMTEYKVGEQRAEIWRPEREREGGKTSR